MPKLLRTAITGTVKERVWDAPEGTFYRWDELTFGRYFAWRAKWKN
jgi:hypothetical protein